MKTIDYKLTAKTAISGVLWVLLCISLVVMIGNYNQDKIKFNEKQVLLNQLKQLVDGFDNDILTDKIIKKTNLYNRATEVVIYSAKKHNQEFAKLYKYTYPKGYSGDIVILTAINTQNIIIGTRILKHNETPGLGDKIELKKSAWIKSFAGVSLDNKIWKVQKYGGDFDSWSGATITPQAVINATKELLMQIKAKKI